METVRRNHFRSFTCRYPGNINVLCVAIDSYIHVLQQTQGVIPEFVNPKYADSQKTSFRSPCRLECMMQDLPKLMDPKMHVGYCSLPRWVCFSAAKNSEENARIQEKKTGYGESIYSMEEDFYKLFRRVLRSSLFTMGDSEKDEEITPAVGIPSTPIVVLSPKTALSISEMSNAFSGNVELKSNSILYLDGMNIHLKDVVVDGSLLVKSIDTKSLLLENKYYKNKGWRFIPSEDNYLRT